MSSAFTKYEYNTSLYMPFVKIGLKLILDFLIEVLLSLLFDEDFALLLIVFNKNLGIPSFFFSLYIIILEQVPIKFLNKTISFISSIVFEFLSLPISNCNDIDSTLLIPTYISPLIIVFFLLNLKIRQFVSFSDNLWEKSFFNGVVN